MKKTVIGAVLGVILGIAGATWFDVQDDQAYYSTVAITGLIFACVVPVIWRKK